MMETEVQGIIYWLDRPLDALQLNVPLEGGYLLRPVHDSTMSGREQSSAEPLVLRFFSGSDRSVVLCFCPTDTLGNGATGYAWGRARQFAEQDASVQEIGRFVWTNASFETAAADVSNFLRNSTTLTEESYLCIGRLKTAVDARGLAVFSPEPGGERATRALVAYMLGLAYHRVLEQSINDLAECCRDAARIDRTEPMHADVSRFLASYYFEAPARVVTTEVGPLYAAIRDRLLLGPLRKELVDQLSGIAELVRMRRTAAESAFETKLQRYFTVLGVLIGLVGLVQLTQTTPAQLQAFASSWKAFFSRNATASTSSAPPDAEADGGPEHRNHQAKRPRSQAQ